MAMPKPSDKHERLKDLVGEWSGAETIHPAPWDPAGGTAEARIVNRHVLDGFGVVQEYEQTRGGGVTFKGHGVFWYDETAQEYVMTWWDSMGGNGAQYRGHWEGDRLVLRSPMPQGGHARAMFDVSESDHYAFLMEISSDGDTWMPAMEGKYRKQRAPRPVAQSAKKVAPRERARASVAKTRLAKSAVLKAAPKKAGAKKVAKKPLKKATSKRR